MADAKTQIVTHNGRIVVMNGSIVMGPCEPAWFLKINGMPFFDFSREVEEKKVSSSFVMTISHTDWAGTTTSTQTSKTSYMPLGGGFNDEGSVLVSEWSQGVEHDKVEVSGTSFLGILGFRVFEIDEDGNPSLVNLSNMKKPRAGVFLVDFGVSVSNRLSHVNERTYSDPIYNVSTNGTGEICNEYDVFLRFEVEEDGEGGYKLASQEILSSQEAYDSYGEKFRYVSDRYTVAGGVYLKGVFDMDVTITVEKGSGGS